jgi:DNA-methyltransferase (dcm)
MKAFDVYCGMGGLSLGLLLAVEGLRITGIDIDPYAVRTYNHNLSRFGANAIVADALKWKPERCDLIVGGSPCQPFSIASPKKGEDHLLFPTLSRFFDIVAEAEPRAFLFENVKGLVSRRFRQLFEAQISRLSKDYDVSWTVLDSADYGVPQHRERLFVAGIRKDIGIRFSFPEPTHAETELVRLDGRKLSRWITVREAIGDIMFALVSDGKKLLQTRSKLDRRGEEESKVMIFMDSRGRIVEIPWTEYQSKHPPVDPDAPSPAVISHVAKSSRTGLLAVSVGLETVYRRLTVKECLRLQSFPDWWSFPESVSVSRRYKLVGEAVPPIIAYRLGLALAEVLGLKTRKPKREEWDLPYFDRVFAGFGD